MVGPAGPGSAPDHTFIERRLGQYHQNKEGQGQLLQNKESETVVEARIPGGVAPCLVGLRTTAS